MLLSSYLCHCFRSWIPYLRSCTVRRINLASLKCNNGITVIVFQMSIVHFLSRYCSIDFILPSHSPSTLFGRFEFLATEKSLFLVFDSLLGFTRHLEKVVNDWICTNIQYVVSQALLPPCIFLYFRLYL